MSSNQQSSGFLFCLSATAAPGQVDGSSTERLLVNDISSPPPLFCRCVCGWACVVFFILCACVCILCCRSVLEPAEGTDLFPLVRSQFPVPLFLSSLAPLSLFERSLFLYLSFVSHRELITVTHTCSRFCSWFFFWLSMEDKKHWGTIGCASGTKKTVVGCGGFSSYLSHFILISFPALLC